MSKQQQKITDNFTTNEILQEQIQYLQVQQSELKSLGEGRVCFYLFFYYFFINKIIKNI